MPVFMLVPGIVGVVHFRATLAAKLDIRMVSIHVVIELLYQRKQLVT